MTTKWTLVQAFSDSTSSTLRCNVALLLSTFVMRHAGSNCFPPKEVIETNKKQFLFCFVFPQFVPALAELPARLTRRGADLHTAVPGVPAPRACGQFARDVLDSLGPARCPMSTIVDRAS